MTKRVLLTGAAGFSGHHVLEHLLVNTDWDIVATASFRHRGTADRITQVLDGHPSWRDRAKVYVHDLTAPFSNQALAMIGGREPLDYVIAMASESHVDRSISDPVPFVASNVQIILNTLELARELKPKAVIVVSTDEVYGPTAGNHAHKEWAPILPSSPYAASKAAQEAIAISYWRTYGVPVILTNCMNMIGERQDPEKFLPMLIKRISSGGTATIHGTLTDIGSRHYLHARNAASAWLFLLQHTRPGMFPLHNQPDRWNIAGADAVGNLDLAQQVATIIGRPLVYELVDFHSARPGHDPHYGLDMTQLTRAGWKPPVDFSESLERTVNWSVQHPEWLM